MFKNLFKAKHKNHSEHDKHVHTDREKTAQSSSPRVLEEIHDKPFEIDLDELHIYDTKELQEFIKKYEQFTGWMRSKYNDMLSEYIMAKERLSLMDEERKRLLNQNEQSMAQIENLKKSLEEKRLMGFTLSEVQSTKSSSSQQNNEPGLDFVSLEEDFDPVMAELKLRAEKLISELSNVREAFNKDREVQVPVLMPVEEKEMEEKNEPEEVEKEESNKEEAVPSEEDVQENVEEEKPEEEKKPEEKLEEKLEEEGEGENKESEEKESEDKDKSQEESPLPQFVEEKEVTESNEKQDIGKILEAAEAELKEILSSYSKLCEKSKAKDKEIAERIRREAVYKARSEEYEQQITGLKEKVSETQKSLEDTIGKLKTQEKLAEDEKKKLEENTLHFQEEKDKLQETIIVRDEKIEELEKAIEDLKENLKASEERKIEAEKDNDETQKRMKTVQEECNDKIGKKEKIEVELRKELHVCQTNLQETEEERKKFEKKYNNSETKKNDIENSLIQEKLKHHQTAGDLERNKEKLVEMEKSLNEEIEARKADIRKNEELRRHLVEMERKLKEHRRVITKLSEQVMDLENGVTRENNEKSDRVLTEASPSNGTKSEKLSTEHGETNEIGIQDYMEKTLLVNSQATKIQQLETKVEEMMKEMKSLKDNNELLNEDKQGLAHQIKVLQEKRETGLQEIKRLSLLLEKFTGVKGKGSLPEMCVPVEKKNGKSDESQKILRVGSMSAIQNSGRNGGNENYEYLARIKHGLEEIYKDIILTITNEKLQESSGDRKASGKLGQLVKGPLPSENFMKIEKKINDTLVRFQELMENFE